VQGEGIMFLFTDSQIVDEKMLVYVNDLLSSGEIPDLFAQEDKDEIINAVRSETKALGLVDTSENCWSTFIQKVSSLTTCLHRDLRDSWLSALVHQHLSCSDQQGISKPNSQAPMCRT